MQPLLSIQTVPIAIEHRSSRASLEYQPTRPSYNVTRSRGRSEIKSDPVRVKIDSFEARASIGLKTARRSIEEYGSNSKSIGMEGIRLKAETGNQIVDGLAQGGNPMPEIARSRSIPDYQMAMVFLPSVGPEFSVEGGSVSFDFTMDRLSFDWNTHHRPQADYIPGGVNFSVSQYPQVIIEYLGDPFYVPPSADPNYDPPPVLDATA